MVLYWSFVAQALVPHALFYGLWWRFAVRRAPAPGWAHALALTFLSLQGAIWLYAANLGGPPAPGGPAWILVTLVLPGAAGLAVAWIVREILRLRTPDELGQLPRPDTTAVVLTLLGLVLWGLVWAFTALVVALAMSEGSPRGQQAAQSSPYRPQAPTGPIPAPPPGYRIETPQPPATSPEDAQLAAEQEWSREALAWEARNPRFLADPARAAAMQQAIHDVEQSDGQLPSKVLLDRAEALAFERTGWADGLRSRLRACGDTFTRKLRQLDDLPLGEFGTQHQRIADEKARCEQAAR